MKKTQQLPTDIQTELQAIKNELPLFSDVIVRDPDVAACGDFHYVYGHMIHNGVPVVMLTSICCDDVCHPIVDPSRLERRWKPNPRYCPQP
jgi:hypothetical protein